jgi:hypothetical protein
MWLLVGTALASAPVVTVDADGTVVGVAVVAGDEAAVRALLGDVEREAGLSPSVQSVEVEAEEGSCARVRKTTRGLFRPFELVVLRCPTDAGWREDLVRSDDFSVYATEWRIAPSDAGTRVEFRVRTTVNVMVPAAAVRAGTVDATRAALVKLGERASSTPPGGLRPSSNSTPPGGLRPSSK